jgi:ABC-type glycerol-3-phosphate transport system substrate-binding protein
MGAVTYRNKLYALPYQVFTELLLYNEDLLTREGQAIPTKDWTWDKLLEVCKAITRPPSEKPPWPVWHQHRHRQLPRHRVSSHLGEWREAVRRRHEPTHALA